MTTNDGFLNLNESFNRIFGLNLINLNESSSSEKIKISNIFDGLKLLDDLYMNLPEGKEEEFDFLNDLFGSTTNLTFEQFCEGLFEYIDELTEVELFDYTKKEIREISKAFNNPKTKPALVASITTEENRKKFEKYTNF